MLRIRVFSEDQTTKPNERGPKNSCIASTTRLARSTQSQNTPNGPPMRSKTPFITQPRRRSSLRYFIRRRKSLAPHIGYPSTIRLLLVLPPLLASIIPLNLGRHQTSASSNFPHAQSTIPTPAFLSGRPANLLLPRISYQPEPNAASPGSDAAVRLRLLAKQERATGTATPQNRILLPPGLSKTEFQLVDAQASPAASLSLTEALAAISDEFLRLHPLAFQHPATEANAPDENAMAQAERLFIQAREQYLDEDYFASIQTAEQALRYLPQAVPILRLLAHDYLKTTGRAQARTYFNQILQVDSYDEESLMHAGRMSFEQGRDTESAEYFGRLLFARPQDDNNDRDASAATGLPVLRNLDDPGLRYVAASSLGDVLNDLDYLQASAEAWKIAIELPAEIRRSRFFQQEIMDLTLRRGALLRQLGDTLLRLGKTQSALGTYDRAATFPLTDPFSLVPRRIYAYLLEGLTKSAMQSALDALQSDQFAANRRIRELLAYLRPLPDSNLLAQAIAELAHQNPQSLSLILAAATILPDDEGINLVEKFLDANSDRADAWNQLLPWAVQTGGAKRTLEMIVARSEWVRKHPTETANAFLNLVGRTTEAAQTWSQILPNRRKTIEANLIRSRILALLGEYDRALSILNDITKSSPNDIDILLTRLQTLAEAGRISSARNLLFKLKKDGDELNRLFTRSDRVYRAADLTRQLGDPQFAVQLMDDFAKRAETHQPPPSFDPVDHLIRNAELLIALRRNVESEPLLVQAIEKDPKREKPYLLILRLYGSDETLRDPDKSRTYLMQLVRELPDSRAIRLLRAEQDSATGRFDRSIPAYITLLDEDIEDVDTLNQLTLNWIRSKRLADGIRWLERKIETRPGDYNLRDALIDLQVTSGELDAAVNSLRAVLAANPYDDATSLKLIQILRANGRDEEARDVRKARLEHRPESIERSVLLANLAIDSGRLTDVMPLLTKTIHDAQGDLAYHADRLIALARKYREASAADQNQIDKLIMTIAREAQAESQNSPDRIPNMISMYAYQSWCQAAAQLGLGVDEIKPAIEGAIRDYPKVASTIVRLTALTLQKANHLGEASRIADLWIRATDPHDWKRADAQLVVWRVTAAAEQSEKELAVQLAEKLNTAGLIVPFLFVRGETSPLADFLYQTGSLFLNRKDTESYEYLLKAALKVDPDYPGALNDLGYSWIDRGENLEQAEKMIVKVIRKKPANEAYIDTLGWLRYKQGQFEDKGTLPEQLGAVSLLKEAATDRSGRDDPVILNHYGDALWRSGKHEEALKIWRRIKPAYDRQIEVLRTADEDQIKTLEDQYLPIVENATEKIKAVENGKEPQTSLLAGDQ